MHPFDMPLLPNHKRNADERRRIHERHPENSRRAVLAPLRGETVEGSEGFVLHTDTIVPFEKPVQNKLF